MKSKIAIFLILFAFLGIKAQNPDCVIKREVLYRPGDYGSLYYRIPAIITAKDGTLVAFTDKRKFNESDLPSDIDVVCNYSTDNGSSWSEPYTIAEGQGVGKGFGDVGVCHSLDDNGLIVVFTGGESIWKSTPEKSNRAYMARSNDNGKTWTKPTDITHFLFGKSCNDSIRKNWYSSFFASGNGLLTSKGRIMFVVAVKETNRNNLSNFVVYSDDNGVTWSVSERACGYGDEAKVVELQDGSILMSIRRHGQRAYNISYDGGITWKENISMWAEMTAPACNGDMIRYQYEDDSTTRNVLLHSLPLGHARKNVTIFVSYDNGKTWPIHKVIVPYYSAYSSLCVLNDNTIGMYVEERLDDSKGYEMVFYQIDFKKLIE